eukprot:jgi/Ulvmu1/840/UM010_0214.1
MESVPIVDLDLPAKEIANHTKQACLSAGFFYVKNHGLEESLQSDLFKQCGEFFDLPLEEKMKILADKNNRGYTPYKEETLSPLTQSTGDTKEGLYFGREVPPEDPEASKPLHGPNQWPSPQLLPDFRPVLTRYFEACQRLGFRLLDALSDSLGMDRAFFRGKFVHPMLFLRPLRYSPEPSAPADGVYGAGAHTDYGMLTILATDGTPGLQILRSRRWLDVVPVPGTLVVNLGDMCERWTNGMYKSTLHRVVSVTGAPRLSCPFFFEPSFDAEVACLPVCTCDQPPRYPPTTAGKHLLGKYAETHAGYTGDDDGEGDVANGAA